MGLAGLVRETLDALGIEDELHLAFIFGYRLDTNKFRSRKFLYSEGVLLRTLVFFKQVFFRVTLRQRDYSQVDNLLYAGTNNQYRALASTARCLRQQGFSTCFIYDYTVTCSESREYPEPARVAFSLREALTALAVFIRRAPSVLRRLSRADNVVAQKKYFDKFLQAYIYIPYFHVLLQSRNPRYVIMSNDHNTPNRCLKLVAQRLQIATVFMQHGAGNVTLPPLDFDYAFLDGLESVEKYIQCAASARAEGREVSSGETSIFLSGSKAGITRRSVAPPQLTVGVAVNPHDLLEDIVALLDTLLGKGLRCIVRAHPTQEEVDVSALRRMSEERAGLSMSVFGQESVGEFLSACSLLVAGSSSIHLEAALAGVPTYYHQFGDTGLPEDYLHHVRGGIARVFPPHFADLEAAELQALADTGEETADATRRFSESFGTAWEGREGELVVATLACLGQAPASLSSLYRRCEDSRGYRAIYQLDTAFDSVAASATEGKS